MFRLKADAECCDRKEIKKVELQRLKLFVEESHIKVLLKMVLHFVIVNCSVFFDVLTHKLYC